MPLSAADLDEAALGRLRTLVRDAMLDERTFANPGKDRIRAFQRRLASQIADIAVETVRELGMLGAGGKDASDIGPLLAALNMLAVSPIRNIMANCSDASEVEKIARVAANNYIESLTVSEDGMESVTHEVTRTQ